MTISQPSPDRLIFHPHGRSIGSLQIICFISLLFFLSEVGLSIFALGWLSSKILSKSRAVSYTVILNDIPNFLLFVLAMAILLVIASIFFYVSLSIFKNASLTTSCTFIRVASQSDRPYSGEVSIEQINIFNRKKIFKISLDKIVDLRLLYGANTPSRSLNVLLITNQWIRPIIIGSFSHSFSKGKSKKIIQSMSEEINRIRDFINLPSQPSYLVDGRCDYSTVALGHKSTQKILEHTSDILTFSSLTYDARTTWMFDLKSQTVTINSHWTTLNTVKKIKLSEIRSIDIKREPSLLIDITREVLLLVSLSGKLFYNLDRDRYSLILILNDGSSFKCQNDYIRIFSSTNLATVREFAELVRSHLNLPQPAATHLPNRESKSMGLTHTKS